MIVFIPLIIEPSSSSKVPYAILPYQCFEYNQPSKALSGDWFGIFFNVPITKETIRGHPSTIFKSNALIQPVNVDIQPCKSASKQSGKRPKVTLPIADNLQWLIRGIPNIHSATHAIPVAEWTSDHTKHTDGNWRYSWRGMFNGKPFSLQSFVIPTSKEGYYVKFSWNDRSQILYRKKSTDGGISSVDLSFVGDIDGDGLPDLLYRASWHYAACTWRLCLSSAATGSALVQEVCKYEEGVE